MKMSISTAASARRGNSIGHSNEIRSRLLNKLGIYDKNNEKQSQNKKLLTPEKPRPNSGYLSTSPSASHHHHHHQIHPPLRGAIPFQVPLKSDPSSSSISKLSSKTKPKIAFSNKVSVLPIPMRNEYSSRIQKRLWNDRLETHQNIARNTMEFAAEGWNWRTVTEDDGMYVCSSSGALIHPVHCLRQQYYQKQIRLQRGNDKITNNSKARKRP